MKVGDIVELKVTKVANYAFWGTAEGKTGFSHCIDWSEIKPIPDGCVPVEGEPIKVRVFYLTPGVAKLPADVSHDGSIEVDFACSPALVDEELWKRHKARRLGQ
jgi:hypothetical protein